jgi:hypothetical protein
MSALAVGRRGGHLREAGECLTVPHATLRDYGGLEAGDVLTRGRECRLSLGEVGSNASQFFMCLCQFSDEWREQLLDDGELLGLSGGIKRGAERFRSAERTVR